MSGRTPWLWAAIAFFSVVMMANAALIYLANSSWTGLTTVGHYQQGLNFNRVLQAQQAQEQLGWQPSLQWMDQGRQLLLVLSLRDRAGQPVTGVQIEGALYRPAQEGYDQTWSLHEQGAGRYETQVVVPLPGVWEVRLRSQSESIQWYFVERIHLKGGGP
ncbi:MAG: FixH family protein [Magnetococcales bacterium]|nr:FixH family protein [Magnetococcales bacterium]